MLGRRSAAGILALTLIFSVSACTTVDSASDSSVAARPEACTQNPAVKAADAVVEKFSAVPNFVPPATAAPFAADALVGKNKRILAIPIGSQFELAKSYLASWQKIFPQYGVKMDTYSNQGTPSEWSAGVQQAITQKYDGILLLGNNPRTFAPAIQSANAAGIPVFDVSSQVKANGPAPGVKIAGATFPASEQAAEIQANWIVSDSCAAAKVLIVTSNDILNDPPHTAALERTLKADCSNCTYTEVNVPVTQWAQKIQSSVQSALIADPTINYVASCCDAMTSFVSAGIQAVGRDGKVSFTGYNGTPAALDTLREGGSLKMTVGEDIECFSTIAADNVMRGLLDLPTVENTDSQGYGLQALRVFTKANVQDAGVPAQFSKGYGSSCADAYHKIWNGAK